MKYSTMTTSIPHSKILKYFIKVKTVNYFPFFIRAISIESIAKAQYFFLNPLEDIIIKGLR